jgi:hypothetical protein
LASCRFFLVDESQVALIELLKKLIPGDWLETFLSAVAGEIDSEDSNILSGTGPLYVGWGSSALFGPPADFIVVSGRSR